MKFSKRETVLLFVLIVLSSLCLTDHFIFKPLRTQTQRLAATNQQLNMELQVWQEKTTKYQNIEPAAMKIQADYRQIRQQLPQSPLLADIIEYLESSAQAANVKLVSVHYKGNTTESAANSAPAGADQTRVQPVNFQIVASGSHFDLLSYVLMIENSPRIYVINKSQISMARTNNGSGGNALNVSVPESDAAASNKSETEIIIPESAGYDQGSSVLNLDFNAYYDTSGFD